MSFFLKEISRDDNSFRGPLRTDCEIRPLIDGREAFATMEEAIADAKESVNISLWVFEPQSPLQSSVVRKDTKARTWMDLLRFAAQSAQVRILLTDFDPLLAQLNHFQTWSAMKQLFDGHRLMRNHQERLQFIASLHPAHMDFAAETLLRPMLEREVLRYNKMKFSSAVERLQRHPGHWPLIFVDATAKKFRIVTKPEFRMFTASHHQKLCIVDGLVGFCGGIDITRKRVNTPRHTSQFLWHDIHCRIDGPAVFDMQRNFFQRWNAEHFLTALRMRGLASAQPKLSLPIVKNSDMPEPLLITGSKGSAKVQILRTFTTDSANNNLPAAVRTDIFEAYQAAIGAAKQYIYLENQYFRPMDIADALIARAGVEKALQIIIVLPFAPEEVVPGKTTDNVTLHGIALQHEALTKLVDTLKARVGIFSLAARRQAREKLPSNLFRSPQIYVHSKVAIVDDTEATIGSANLNGRSFLVDTEINLAWKDTKTSVAEFRQRLWGELLGVTAKEMSGWKISTYLNHWTRIAISNARLPPESRPSLIVPYDLGKAIKGKRYFLIPDAFTNIGSPGPNIVNLPPFTDPADQTAESPLARHPIT